MTLVHPVGPGPLPLLVLAIDDDSATAVLDAARAWAQDGLAVAVVPLAGAVGDAAADQYADALRWLAGRRQQYGFGSCTLCGIGRASAAALQVARVPHLLQDRGLDRRILHGVVAICPDAESLARLPRTAAPPAPPLFGIHDVADTAAIRGFSRLGNDDKVVSLPLPGLTAATAARVLGTVDGPLWPLVLGFATP